MKKLMIALLVLILAINVFAQDEVVITSEPIEEEPEAPIQEVQPTEEVETPQIEPVEELPSNQTEDIEPTLISAENITQPEEIETTETPSVEEETEEQKPEPEVIMVSEPRVSILSRLTSGITGFIKAIFYKVKYYGWWLKTRNYMSAAQNTISKVFALRLLYKIILIIILLIVLLIVWSFYFRDTRSNNLRKARRHHRLGEKYHQKGNEEKAAYHYEQAEAYREKAQEQW